MGRMLAGMLWNAPSDGQPNGKAAVTTLTLLACLNLVSLADRYAVPGVLPLIKAEFGSSDRALGALSSAFFLMFMAMSPVAGWIGDRFPRKPLIVCAALLCSVAMLLTGCSHSYGMLMLQQTLLGVGEAAFAVVTPGVIADLFATSRRGLVMSLYSLTIPVGTAAGLTLPGVGDGAGWRMPLFLMAAIGGIASVAAAFFLDEPRRGAFDEVSQKTSRLRIASLVGNAPYRALVVGAICLAFATVGTAVWLPTFLARTLTLDLAQVSRSIGIATVMDGTVGVLFGGFLVQRCEHRDPGVLYRLSGYSMILALSTGAVALYGPHEISVPSMLATQLLLFVSTAPMAVAMLHAVDARRRATALALSLFLVHLLGGSVAPTVVGWVGDAAGLREGLALALLPLAVGALAMRSGARAAASGSRRTADRSALQAA